MFFTYLQGQEYPTLIFDGLNIKFISQHKHLGLTLSENMKWKSYIDSILTSASHMIGIMRKLKYVFSRRALNQIYISYVRPVLEYSCVVLDGCTVAQRNSLEKLQNEAAKIVTGLAKSVSLNRLYRYCGWQTLQERRTNQKLKLMYKLVNDMVPVRTSTFSKSCIPSAINEWNNLQASFRACDSYNSFCYTLQMQSLNEIPNCFFDGKRKCSILHARLRNFCSNLNQDLFDN